MSAAAAASSAAAAPTPTAAQARRGAAGAAAPVVDEIVELFVLKLKRRELVGSNSVALHTAELLRTLVSRRKYSSVAELLALIRSAGKTLTLAHPIELAIGNIVRRVLYIIRHETAAIVKELAAGGSDSSVQQAQVDLSLSLHKMLDRQQLDLTLDQANIAAKLKPQVIEEIGLLMDEMKGAEIQIAEQAIEHIYAKSERQAQRFASPPSPLLLRTAEFKRRHFEKGRLTEKHHSLIAFIRVRRALTHFSCAFLVCFSFVSFV